MRHHHLSRLLKDYKAAVDATTILSTSDTKGIITYANQKFCEISEYTQKELIGKPHNILRHPDMPEEVFTNMWNTIQKGEKWRGIVKNLSKSGKTYIVDATIIPVIDEHGTITEYIGIRHNITNEFLDAENVKTELLQKQKEVMELTFIDSVTGLANQHSFCDFLDNNSGKLSLLAFRLDHLPNIKDVLGYEFADAYIRDFAKMLIHYTEGFENKLEIYRIDADDICIIIDGNMKNISKTLEDLTSIGKFFFSTHASISMTSPITAVAYTGEGNLRHKITTLLAYAFEKHRGEYIVGNDESPCFADELPANIFWLGKYSDAIEYERMIPFFQAIYNNSNGTIDKYECLARIIDGDDIISPDKFIDLAARAKQIPFLTKAILRKAFEKFKQFPQYEFSVNVSAMDLQDEFLLKYIRYWQEKMGIDPSRIVFEILESEDIYRYGLLKKSIADMKDIGYKIAIDDFGTGYSNFISLFEYKVDYIKIDGSLIKDIATDSAKAEMVDSLNKFIHMCGAKSIAEFVSNAEIQKIAEQIGIDYSQGYYFSKPAQEIL